MNLILSLPEVAQDINHHQYEVNYGVCAFYALTFFAVYKGYKRYKAKLQTNKVVEEPLPTKDEENFQRCWLLDQKFIKSTKYPM